MRERAAIRVTEPGMLTSIQDLGRRGFAGIGVGRGGAADTLSLRAGNRLVGNEDGAAALEMTLTGGTFEFGRDAVVVIAGGAAGARIEGKGATRTVGEYVPFEVRGGERVVCGPIRSGVRAYLCAAGGIMVPRVLGSRSTHLSAGFGGYAGRGLRAGDEIEIGDDHSTSVDGGRAERAGAFCRAVLARRTVRAVAGAHQGTFESRAVESFWVTAFEVSPQSDRRGLRLKDRVGASALGGRMASEAMMPGAVQAPESGEPIVLMVDHPTTGGYPVIACVAAVDLAVLGQVAPREKLQFERISVAEARRLFVEQERAFDAEAPRR